MKQQTLKQLVQAGFKPLDDEGFRHIKRKDDRVMIYQVKDIEKQTFERVYDSHPKYLKSFLIR